AVRLRRAQADLAEAEERAVSLSQEIADRASEHAERVAALTAERDAALEQVRELEQSRATLSDSEHAKVVQALEAKEHALEQLGQQERLAEEAQEALTVAREAADRYSARV